MILTVFDSVTSAFTRPGDIFDVSWDDAVTILSCHHDVNAKDDAKLFNLWSFDQYGEKGRCYNYVNNIKQNTFKERPGTIRRSKVNAIGLYGIVLDVDDTLSIADAIAEHDQSEFLMYTTFRHSPDKHKFRMVFPFERMMTKEEFALKKDSISEYFHGVDAASFSLSQSFYFHSGKTDAATYRNKGVMIDPDQFDDKAEAPPEPIRPIESLDDEWKNKIVLGTITNEARSMNRMARLNWITCAKALGWALYEVKIVDDAIKLSDTNTTTEQLWNGCNSSLYSPDVAKNTLEKRAKLKRNAISETQQLIIEMRKLNEKTKGSR